MASMHMILFRVDYRVNDGSTTLCHHVCGEDSLSWVPTIREELQAKHGTDKIGFAGIVRLGPFTLSVIDPPPVPEAKPKKGR